MSQRNTLAFGANQEEDVCVADLSYSNWVSDLTSLPLASLLLLNDKTMCGQHTL